jgi:hypothetical protein
MKLIERLLIKIIFIQFVFLLLTQLVFHEWNSFPELQQIKQYEGVSEDNLTEIIETFSNSNKVKLPSVER